LKFFYFSRLAVKQRYFPLYVISTVAERNGEISYFCVSKSKCIEDTS